MTFSSKRKRKDDDIRRFSAWIFVLIAVALLVVIAMLYQSATPNARNISVMSAGSTFTHDPFELTATYIITEATAIAQGSPQASS